MEKTTRLIKISFLLLFLFTPLIFASQNSELFELPKMHFVYLLTSVILSLHLINVLNRRYPLVQKSFLNFPLLLFLLSQVISTVLSIDLHTSIYGYYSRLNGGLLSLLSFSTLFFIAQIYFDHDFKQKIVNIFLFSGLLVSVFGILQHFGIDKHLWVQDVQTRVFSTLGQPNWLAAYLCLLLPFSLSKFFSSPHLFHRFYFLLLTASFYLSLLFTKSKSGIIAAVISLSIFFLIFTLRQIRLQKFKPTIFFPILLILVLSLLVKNPIHDYLFPESPPPTQPPVDSNINITPSEDIRQIVWQGALDLWRQFPYFGTGTETFAYSYYWTRPPSHNLTSEWDFLYNKAHNEYLNHLATTGTFGLLSYAVLILAIIFFLFKNLSKPNLPHALPAFSAFISLLITNFAGFSVVITSLFFFLLPTLVTTPPAYSPTKPKRLPAYLPFLLLLILSRQILFSYLADITYAQSQTLDSQNNYSAAYDQLTRSLNYKNEPLYHSKISSLAAKLAITQPETEKKQYYLNQAIHHSDISITLSPANTSFWKERAQVFYYLSSIDTQHFLQSIDSLLRVSHLAPTDAKTFYLLGKFLDSVDQKDQAISYYQQAIILKPNYDHAYFNLAQIYYQQQNTPDAIKNLELTLKFAPANTQASELLNQLINIPLD